MSSITLLFKAFRGNKMSSDNYISQELNAGDKQILWNYYCHVF